MTYQQAITRQPNILLNWYGIVKWSEDQPTIDSLLLSSHLCLAVPSDLFFSGFPTIILCAFLILLMCSTFPTHLIISDDPGTAGCRPPPFVCGGGVLVISADHLASAARPGCRKRNAFLSVCTMLSASPSCLCDLLTARLVCTSDTSQRDNAEATHNSVFLLWLDREGWNGRGM